MIVDEIPNLHKGHDANQNRWYCSSVLHTGEGPSRFMHDRYLQQDGTWGRRAFWFDSEAEIDAALSLGHKPDFTMPEREKQERGIA